MRKGRWMLVAGLALAGPGCGGGGGGAGEDTAANAGPRPQSASTREDRSVAIRVLDNDGQPVALTAQSLRVVTQPASGTASTRPEDRSIIYRPDPDFFGLDTFRYRVAREDGTASAPVAVEVTVVAVNDPPSFVAGSDQVVPAAAGPQVVASWASRLSPGPANESGQAISAFLVSTEAPSLFAESPVIDPDGTLRFTPAERAWGTTLVRVRAADDGGTKEGGEDTSGEQTFTIRVTPPADLPAASDDAVAMQEDGGERTIDVLSNDAFGSDGPGRGGVRLVALPRNGTAAVDDGGSPEGPLDDRVVYTPAPDFHGSDSLEYEIADASGDISTALVSIEVTPVNDAPTFETQGDVVVNEDGGSQRFADWASQLSPGPADEASQRIEGFVVENFNAALFASPPVVEPDGTLAFTPARDAWGSAIIQVRLRDDGGTADGGDDTSSPRAAAITVRAVNDAPTFTAGASPVVREDGGPQMLEHWASAISAGPANEASQTLIGFEVTHDRDTLFAEQPALGLDGTLTFTPAPNANGVAQVTARLLDSGGTARGGEDSSPAHTFSITVTPWVDLVGFEVRDARLPRRLGLRWSKDGEPGAGQIERYRIEWNPDGVSGFEPVAGHTNIPELGLPEIRHSLSIPVHRLDWRNAAYRVVALDGSDRPLSASAPAPLLGMVSPEVVTGYFKAGNTGTWDEFGTSVALSRDGDVLAVGARGERGNATGPENDELPDAGAVYVFSRTAGGLWEQEAYLKAGAPDTGDFFGRRLALSADGRVLAVAADADDSALGGISSTGAGEADNSLFNAGAVHVFTRSPAGTWTREAYIKPGHPGASDRFGVDLDLSQDGAALVVGALWEDGSGADPADDSLGLSGAAYVFRREAGVWSQEAYLKADNADVSDGFGNAVAISAMGDRVVVAASAEDSDSAGISPDGSGSSSNGLEDSGAVYVFDRESSGGWVQTGFLKAGNPDSGDFFGSVLALDASGDTVAVAATGEQSDARGVDASGSTGYGNDVCCAGAVYLFSRTSSGWLEQAYVKASNTEGGDFFGRSIALSGDGRWLAAGATDEDSSATGVETGLEGQDDNSAGAAGAIYLYRSGGSTGWRFHSYVKAPNTGEADGFGASVALDGTGEVMSVGAPAESSGATGVDGDSGDDSANRAGAAYLY